MLKIAEKLKDLSFGQLMEVYAESTLERGQELYPDETEARQTALGEQEFYNYLDQVFFQTHGARYAVWQADGKYVSALRLEAYRDGLLLEALETAPAQRRKGYGEALIRAVLQRCGHSKIYSHVVKWNEPSLKIHEKCGFQRILEYAVYADGSYNHVCCTLLYEI